MITKAFSFRISTTSPLSGIVFEQQLNDIEIIDPIFSGIYYNYPENQGYGGWFALDQPSIDANLVYDVYHNGRFHTLFSGLKYYLNVSDLWYMTAVLTGYRTSDNPIGQKRISLVSQQSFANINLGVDAIYLSLKDLLPIGKELSEGVFDASTPGIRLVLFIDKLEMIERTVIGGKRVNNLQFHFTIKAHLIDPSLGGQYKDFTSVSLLGQKSFYYEQSVPTYDSSDFSTAASLKTGWGHFIYPATTGKNSGIKYVQLRDVLKTIYNGMIFSQSTDNNSIKVDSSVLLEWLNTDTTLRNATTAYEPSSVIPKAQTPVFPFTDKDVMETWLEQISLEASNRGRPGLDFLFSYDNIHWEPLADLYSGDVYSNSPSTFMTRLTTYYQGTGQTPVDEPGNFDSIGGYPKSRRKGFLAYLIENVVSNFLFFDDQKQEFSPYMVSDYPQRILGPKFFPFYEFVQYKDNTSGKELLDIKTIPFSGTVDSVNVVESETSDDLKRVVSDNLNQYRRKIITKPQVLPGSLGSTITEKINSIGFVSYMPNEGSWRKIPLDVNSASNANYVFSFLTWIFANPPLLNGLAEWTRGGRYLTWGTNLETGPGGLTWKGRIALCEMMLSGMYDTPEEAYKEFKRVQQGIYVTSEPSATDPQWKDYFACLPAVEVIETITEYCDPSPAIDGTPVVKMISKQRVSISANGTRTNIGDPVNEFPTTTVVLKNQQGSINGNAVLGNKTVIYQNCTEIFSKFDPYKDGSGGTGPTPNVDVGIENFINPAIFNRNIIKLEPSSEPITLELDKCYYALEFNRDNIGDSSSDYRIRLSPGNKGQVIVLEIRTMGTPYKGVLLENGSNLTTDSANQKVWLSTDTWGDGGGQGFKSVLFMVFDGNNWIEFMRRDIY